MGETYEIIVIGSGPGGYVSAIRAAQLGFKVACIEKEPTLGGTCLNIGCIPSKSLLQSSELYHQITHDAKEHGIDASAKIDFAQMMKRKNQVVTGFNQGIESLFKKNKITCIEGKATFTSSHTLSIGNKEISAKYFILSTGSEPVPLPFLPFDGKQVLSSTEVLELKKIPKKMIVIGAGIIGVELGSVYSRLGTEVIFVEFLNHICGTLDESLSKGLQKVLIKQGMTFYLSTKVTSGHVSSKEVTLSLEKIDQTSSQITGDVVLVSIGRRPYTKELGLDKIGIKTDKKGFIPIDDNFRTFHSHIYAIGDIVNGPMLAHKASEEGYVVAELIAGKNPYIEYMSIPSVIYTYPEASSVGLTEVEAQNMNIPIKIGIFPLKANSRARCSGDDEGFIKIIACSKGGTILGVHILSAHAGELIAEATLAIEKRITVFELGKVCHPHPTLSEALKEAALVISKKAIHI